MNKDEVKIGSQVFYCKGGRLIPAYIFSESYKNSKDIIVCDLKDIGNGIPISQLLNLPDTIWVAFR